MNTNLSAQRRQTRDRIKTMIMGHLETFSEIRFTDWCKLNRVTPLNFLYAIEELIQEKKAKRSTRMYLAAGPHGYESYQVFEIVAPAVEEDINVRFCESCGRGWSAAA